MIYLASPYTHPDAAMRELRFQAVAAAAAALLRAGHLVFSPITHSHPMAVHGLPFDWKWWEQHARWHLERCDEVAVLMLDGWERSVGVRAEIEIATSLGKPVWYRHPVRATSPTFACVAGEAGS